MVLRMVLRICEGAVNLITALALVLWGSYGAYALWDNSQILTTASQVQAELLRWKPEGNTPEEAAADNGEAFEQLRRMNPDVCGWLTMDGTGIDHPVVQGQNNLSYISRDVFGNFSLAGSIFLDSRDDPYFSESYALLYGHHMADGNMFGDLDLYQEEFFALENGGGQLILPDRVWQLETVACLVVGASEKWIFDPEFVRGRMEDFPAFVRENALWVAEDWTGGKVLALSTCSSEFTDARTVVLARMEGMEREE